MNSGTPIRVRPRPIGSANVSGLARVSVSAAITSTPPVSPDSTNRIRPLARPEAGSYDAIILAVAHREFRELGVATIRAWGKPEHVLFDLKYLLPKEAVDLRL